MIWRQGAEALRNAGSLVKIALVTVGVPGVMVVVLAAGDGEQGLGPGPFACIMVLAMTLFMTQNLALDFRRDLDRMAYLKSLPLPAQTLALGQILPAIGVFTVLQLLAFAIIVLVFGVALPFPAPMLLLLVLFNWLLMALDNVLFLWFPYRFVPNEAGNVQFLGRLMMFSFARLFAFAAALGMAAASGWLGWWWGGESIWLAGLGAVGMLTILAIGLTCLLGSAFRHFDLTRDVPG